MTSPLSVVQLRLALDCPSKDINAPEYACIIELMNAVDDYIPTPDRKSDLPFLMPVEDTMTISGRGTVATGRVREVSSSSTIQLKSQVLQTSLSRQL